MKKILHQALLVTVFLVCTTSCSTTNSLSGNYTTTKAEIEGNELLNSLFQGDSLQLSLNFLDGQKVVLTDDFGHKNLYASFSRTDSTLSIFTTDDTINYMIQYQNGDTLVLAYEINTSNCIQFFTQNLTNGKNGFVNNLTDENGNTKSEITSISETVISNLGKEIDKLLMQAIGNVLSNINYDTLSTITPGLSHIIQTVNDSIVKEETKEIETPKSLRVVYHLCKTTSRK
ncbi:MAG: hypothetical protein KBT45_03555 [Bacteroidales bacterium]|nr:hypothetical protein [Candidatus Colimorpha pelethequi]